MMTQSAHSASDPQGIGNAFVEKFYTVLHEDPSHAYKFYLDLSVLSRPAPDGAMKSVTTLKDINELILSLDYQSFKAEISFADAQFSYANGVIVLVTGSLIGKDDVRRKFTQTFFLAPQEGGYYVLNDVFRYVDNKEPADVACNDVNESTQAALPQDPAPVNALANHAAAPSDNDGNSGEEFNHPLDYGKHSVSENGVADEQVLPPKGKSQNDSHPVSQTASPRIQDDAPKKSYASVVHDLTKNPAPFTAPPPKPRPAEQSCRAAEPEELAPKSNKGLERNNERSGQNTSIFAGNLPMNATEEMLSKVLKKFGPIKPSGIQVRSSKDKNNCYGFVEFESATSMQSAVMASPITIGNRKVYIEEKRGANNDGKRGEGGYRDENGYRNEFRGRGNFNGANNEGQPEKGGYRDGNGYQNDSFGGRGNFNGANHGGKPGWGGYRDENGYRNDNFKVQGNVNSSHNFGRNERNEFPRQAQGSTARNGDANGKRDRLNLIKKARA